jgi:hypothetical protein
LSNQAFREDAATTSTFLKKKQAGAPPIHLREKADVIYSYYHLHLAIRLLPLPVFLAKHSCWCLLDFIFNKTWLLFAACSAGICFYFQLFFLRGCLVSEAKLFLYHIKENFII